ncbi:MAG: ABC transporter ATP-binding protein [Streptococcus thermophilus]|uniref:ABC transporter ATP-binding protein n=3 Tax=Streptococcus thermophilus TaxID=1308 RepID=A0A3G6K1K9_STRTR|nr:ABC transporter ATP-binding protein [Streptococcus thermophilus]AZA18540.1 MAG: ABC transporter ATP-binding protein [Streptococcus thermophilus]AZA23821.1 MAG: ABC transporter ATP-binding protein [Streptococcus thermophilus]MCE2103404.1 ATP-binding cassette domain-containing protein [Streptococcus thermophilus]MCE2108021.1 ATP-binding cassette domain-containing protein [Streptococcus thermophilus]MCE2113094.1 ATP-binding cassette domain-containing protein [Streptococcus thermophilus]
MTDKQIAVKVDHVSKYFKLPTEATNSLRTALVNRFKGIKGYKEQHVLKDISFEVEKGDFFGILGRNGSGKSTLLKIISEIYVPEKGTVTIDGKLVSFIELGVGFNPELTGRENVYMNGAMLGFSTAEIDAMYDDIVDFAELHDFMNQKLKNYSSGMQVRLAFSVAIKAQGDILILDEVLAVGDEAFQRKCNDYFQERKKSGKTTILVTHDMGAVKKYCNKAVLIENGLVKAIGSPENVANQYSFDNTAPLQQGEETSGSGKPNKEERVLVENFQLQLLSSNKLRPQDPIQLQIDFDVREDIQTYIALSLTDIDRNIWIYNDNSMDQLMSGSGHKTVHYTCSLPTVNDLKMKLEVTVRDEEGQMLAFSDATQTPLIFINRDDIALDDKSAMDAASGLIQRNGTWSMTD